MSDGRTSVTLGGHTVEVVDAATAEQATFVVCGTTSFFLDDVRTHCAFCHRGIVHRPNVPVRPVKICVPCAIAVANTSRES